MAAWEAHMGIFTYVGGVLLSALPIIAAVAGGILLLVLGTALVCFFMVFYSPTRKPLGEGEYQIPPGEVYAPFRDAIIGWTDDIRAMPHEQVSITSHDGLTLRGRYYEFSPDAPMELMFHGYKGNAERDLCGGVARAFAVGHSALIVDHRASGTSDGHIISFGINEHKDCLRWIEFAREHYGADKRLILTGISMGAATVMMASGCELPDNILYVLADCGYTSPREIIKKVMRDMHLPTGIFYPFVKLGARLFGRFDLEETSPVEAMARCRVPVVFAHGDNDAYVPCDMSRENYAVCHTPKKLIIIHGAGHGLCYPASQEEYVAALIESEKEFGIRE